MGEPNEIERRQAEWRALEQDPERQVGERERQRAEAQHHRDPQGRRGEGDRSRE